MKLYLEETLSETLILYN